MAQEDEDGQVESLQAEIAELQEERRRLTATHDRWMRVAGTDAMTGLPNKTFFTTALLPQAIEQSRAEGQGVGCLLIAPDRLVEYNGRHGRRAGDEFVKQLAAFLADNLAGDERVVRVDGANFCVIVPGADLNRTKRRSLELRTHYTNHKFEGVTTQDALTLSLGAVAHELTSGSANDVAALVSEFLERLWAVLDQARQLGGDREQDDPQVDF